MPDQASVLRRLVRQTQRESVRQTAPRPRLLVLSGALPGAGATTLAVNLAVALAEQGGGVVLADADTVRPAVRRLCEAPGGGSLADVWSGRQELAGILQPGPAGVLVAGGQRTSAAQEPYRKAFHRRWLRQLGSLGPRVAWVLVDTGSAAGAAVQPFWRAADQVALVLTPESAAIVEAYARIKQAGGARRPVFGLIVNRAADRPAASRVHRCVSRSCRRFLGTRIAWWGYVREDPSVPAAEAAARPFAGSPPRGPAGRDVQVLAGRIAERFAVRARPARTANQDKKVKNSSGDQAVRGRYAW